MSAQKDDGEVGLDEALKASDQMVWVRKVNALRAMAEEVVLWEIVYQQNVFEWIRVR